MARLLVHGVEVVVAPPPEVLRLEEGRRVEEVPPLEVPDHLGCVLVHGLLVVREEVPRKEARAALDAVVVEVESEAHVVVRSRAVVDLAVEAVAQFVPVRRRSGGILALVESLCAQEEEELVLDDGAAQLSRDVEVALDLGRAAQGGVLREDRGAQVVARKATRRVVHVEEPRVLVAAGLRDGVHDRPCEGAVLRRGTEALDLDLLHDVVVEEGPVRSALGVPGVDAVHEQGVRRVGAAPVGGGVVDPGSEVVDVERPAVEGHVEEDVLGERVVRRRAPRVHDRGLADHVDRVREATDAEGEVEGRVGRDADLGVVALRGPEARELDLDVVCARLDGGEEIVPLPVGDRGPATRLPGERHRRPGEGTALLVPHDPVHGPEKRLRPSGSRDDEQQERGYKTT
jgi:hypothetical protein